MKLLRPLLLSCSLLFAAKADAEKVTIAAAANLKFAMDEIVAAFKKTHPAGEVEVIYGSSGKFHTQIKNGASYDLYFSADIAYPRELVKAGFAASEVKPYAFGRIVLWSASMDASKMTLESLLDPKIARIAIANPKHAPYGKRAEEALRASGLWEEVEPKLVYGENIAHTAQLVQTGNAQVGVIALSLAVNPELAKRGGYWLISDNLHEPLEQGLVITKRAASNALARRFADFMSSPAARAVMIKYGFFPPGEVASKKRSIPLCAHGPCASAMPVSGLAEDNVFELGTIMVTAPRPQLGEIAPEQVASVVTRKDIQTYNRETVGDAVNLLSGVTISTNSRNEQSVYLRGYDPRQAPLFIDGIPVYVPYDGYVDFGRFDTADLAAIQVAKGFSSVAFGPNTLGGAINLISRKPKKAFESDISSGFGEVGARRAAVNLGSNQGSWYVQAGAAYREVDGFRFSNDFTPTATEDGGRRDNSYYKDSKVSLKLGLTPGGGDEYALTYIKQDGEKGQPPSTVPPARYWKWPYWDKESLYFVSRTGLGAHETLKLRLYSDKFDNEVNSYTDNTYTRL